LDNAEIIIDERISEYDMGSLTGTPIRKVTSHELISAKGAEEPGKFMGRVHDLIKEIKKIDGPVLIISHGGVGRIIEAKKRGIPAENFYDLDCYSNAQIIELDL
jgi:broad specificity phosphatase PhoE